MAGNANVVAPPGSQRRIEGKLSVVGECQIIAAIVPQYHRARDTVNRSPDPDSAHTTHRYVADTARNRSAPIGNAAVESRWLRGNPDPVSRAGDKRRGKCKAAIAGEREVVSLVVLQNQGP